MTNFLDKLMFWRKSPEGEASAPPPGSGPDKDTLPPSPEELAYREDREERLFEQRREQDDVAP